MIRQLFAKDISNCPIAYPYSLLQNTKGPTRIGSTCVAHTSPRSAAAVTSLRH